MLKCGFAQTDITPKLGLLIPGYFNKRYADGVIDPLYARAFVIDDGTTVLAIVVMDIIHVSAKSTDMIRRRVNEFTGIDPKNIMVSATHTHTGSSTDRNNDISSADYQNVVMTANRTADAIILAFNKREEAKIGYGSCDEHEVGFNRRYIMTDGTLKTNPGIKNPKIVRVAAPIDPQVGVIRVDGADGTPLGAVVNFSCHPDVVGGTKYCADYIGELCRSLKREYGENFGVVFQNGCCGDINHIDAIGGTNIARGKQHLKMGRILAADAAAVFEKTATTDEVVLDSSISAFLGTRRRPTEADVEWSRNILKDPNSDYVDISYANSMISMYENPLPNPDIELQALVIGDIAICSLPGEIFTAIGLDIKAGSPYKHNMVCELANGYYGYVATEKDINDGGYETRINMSTNLAANTAPQMVSGHLELLKQMKDKQK